MTAGTIWINIGSLDGPFSTRNYVKSIFGLIKRDTGFAIEMKAFIAVIISPINRYGNRTFQWGIRYVHGGHVLALGKITTWWRAFAVYNTSNHTFQPVLDCTGVAAKWSGFLGTLCSLGSGIFMENKLVTAPEGRGTVSKEHSTLRALYYHVNSYEGSLCDTASQQRLLWQICLVVWNSIKRRLHTPWIWL